MVGIVVGVDDIGNVALVERRFENPKKSEAARVLFERVNAP